IYLVQIRLCEKAANFHYDIYTSLDLKLNYTHLLHNPSYSQVEYLQYLRPQIIEILLPLRQLLQRLEYLFSMSLINSPLKQLDVYIYIINSRFTFSELF